MFVTKQPNAGGKNPKSVLREQMGELLASGKGSR